MNAELLWLEIARSELLMQKTPTLNIRMGVFLGLNVG